LFAALKYAKLPFKKLVQPAIELAEKGFSITARQAEDLNELKKEFTQLNSSRTVFVKKRPAILVAGLLCLSSSSIRN